MNTRPPAIQRIVLTGGPCAGKSTALDRAGRWLQTCGVRVYRVPEASTLLLGGGVQIAGAPLEQMIAFQRSIVRVQLALEEGFLGFAFAQDRHAVLLCDRGVVDGAAYLPEDPWQAVLAETSFTMAQLFGRYDVVISLVSAAVGAEPHYGTHSNAVRYETLEQARLVDERVHRAWRGHPNLRVIDNSGDFETKMHRTLAAVCEVVGVACPAS